MSNDAEVSQVPATACCTTCERPAAPNSLTCDACQPLVAFASRGAQLLDEQEAGWACSPRLDLRKLNMELHGRCLLSLLFGTYKKGIQRLDLGPLLILGGENWDNYGCEHGFTVSPSLPKAETRTAFVRLTAIWKQIILERRQAAVTIGNEDLQCATKSQVEGT